MPRLVERQCPAAEYRCDALVVIRKARLGELQLEFGEHIGCGGDGGRLLAYAPRHLEKNAVYLFVLVVDQPDEFIILLDGFHRLEVNRLSAGAGAVYYALHFAFLLHLHRNDEALAADGDELILRRAALGETSQMRPQ